MLAPAYVFQTPSARPSRGPRPGLVTPEVSETGLLDGHDRRVRGSATVHRSQPWPAWISDLRADPYVSHVAGTLGVTATPWGGCGSRPKFRPCLWSRRQESNYRAKGMISDRDTAKSIPPVGRGFRALPLCSLPEGPVEAWGVSLTNVRYRLSGCTTLADPLRSFRPAIRRLESCRSALLVEPDAQLAQRHQRALDFLS
jgi:hypothetical protein